MQSLIFKKIYLIGLLLLVFNPKYHSKAYNIKSDSEIRNVLDSCTYGEEGEGSMIQIPVFKKKSKKARFRVKSEADCVKVVKTNQIEFTNGLQPSRLVEVHIDSWTGTNLTILLSDSPRTLDSNQDLRAARLIIEILPERYIEDGEVGDYLTTEIFKLDDQGNKTLFGRVSANPISSAQLPCVVGFIYTENKIYIKTFAFKLTNIGGFEVYRYVTGIRAGVPIDSNPNIGYSFISEPSGAQAPKFYVSSLQETNN